MLLPPPTATLFPYTTLFRSGRRRGRADALPAALHHLVPDRRLPRRERLLRRGRGPRRERLEQDRAGPRLPARAQPPDRKSTRLNSSHLGISYAVFCLKKKTT